MKTLCCTTKGWIVFIMVLSLLGACHPVTDKSASVLPGDSVSLANIDTLPANSVKEDSVENVRPPAAVGNVNNTGEAPLVLLYNFHVTNRCASCIAIEEATTKTLKTYFMDELKKGRIRQIILNVDDEKNKAVSEKYEAFGSGLYITRLYKGKETTTDLTGDGFKYARNKEEKFISILKSQITEYLK